MANWRVLREKILTRSNASIAVGNSAGRIEAAGKLLKKYAEMLGLVGWRVSVQTLSGPELKAGDETVMAQTRNVRPGQHTADLVINVDYDFEADHIFTFENVVVHELAHIVLVDLGLDYVEGYQCDNDCGDYHMHRQARELNERLADRIAAIVLGTL